MYLPHTVSHYSVSWSKDTSGAKVPTYTLSGTFPAFVQPAASKVVDVYKQLNETINYSIYLDSASRYAAVGIGDRLVYSGSNMNVRGKLNPCELDKVFRIDTALEVE